MAVADCDFLVWVVVVLRFLGFGLKNKQIILVFPLKTLNFMLSNGESKEIVFYNEMHIEPQHLLWKLLDFFEQEDDD